VLVPTEQIERPVAAVIEEARAQTRDLVELPAGEGVVLEIVHDEPWLGFNFYLVTYAAGSPSTSTPPMSAIDLLSLAVPAARVRRQGGASQRSPSCSRLAHKSSLMGGGYSTVNSSA
jgi:hypothetical protein